MRTELVSVWTLLQDKVKTAEHNAGRFEAAAKGLPAKSLSLNEKGEGALEVCAKEKKQLVFLCLHDTEKQQPEVLINKFVTRVSSALLTALIFFHFLRHIPADCQLLNCC